MQGGRNPERLSFMQNLHFAGGTGNFTPCPTSHTQDKKEGLLMPQFAVGDKVWFAKCQWETVKKTCPICFGKKEVTLVLGNGESILLPCQGCAPGCEPPTGFISEYEFVVEPELLIITGMEIEIDGEKEKVRYRSGSDYFNDIDIFTTEEEARTIAELKKKWLVDEQRAKSENIKKNVHKSFSWNASYHMREAKRHRKDALYHDEKAKLCKERSNNT